MKYLVLIVMLCAACVCIPSEGRADTPWELIGGITIHDADVSPSYWQPIYGGEAQASLVIGLKPFKQEGPDTPTNISEIIPWAKKNLSIDIPFIGDETTVLKLRGLGFSESIQVAEVWNVPLVAGIGYLTGGPGLCWYVKTPVITF